MSFSDEAQEEDEAMLKALGQQQSTIWLFVPTFGPFLSTVGEAMNDTPLFVFDKTAQRALAKAENRYGTFFRTHHQELQRYRRSR